MKNKINMFLLLFVLTIGLTGCNDIIKNNNVSQSVCEEAMYQLDTYNDILDMHYEAIIAECENGNYFGNNMSTMYMNHYKNKPLENIGYATIDISDDNVPELLIGEVESEDRKDWIIYDLYTFIDDKPHHIFSSSNNNRFSLSVDQYDNYIIEEEKINSATSVEWHYYTFSGFDLDVFDGIVFDSIKEDENIWRKIINNEIISEQEANRIIANYELNRILPKYIPFSKY